MSSPKLKVGARVLYDGNVWSVEGLDGCSVRIRETNGQLALVATRELCGAPDFQVLDQGTKDIRWSTAEFDNLPQNVKSEVLEFAAHLNEALTGFRSGSPDVAESEEPREGYDPCWTGITERLERKRKELGISRSSIHEKVRRYRAQGVLGLVDRRRTKPRSLIARQDSRVIEAMLAVLNDLTEKSNASCTRIFIYTELYLTRKYGPDVVSLPSESTMRRVLKELTKGRGTFGPAKGRRSIANRPETPFGRLKASRPGEVVLIDSSPLDVFALDPIKGWASHELIIALDVYTRSILAWRITPKNPKAVDAVLLLRDIITPTTMRPHWPESVRWPYHGVPETLLLNGPGEQGVAGVPVVAPETVAVDRAKIYLSAAFWNACGLLGINVRPARPYQPEDKAQVERIFLTIRKGFWEYLPGYKGPDIWSRGKDIEQAAFYLTSEIEEIFAEWVVRIYQRKKHDGLRMPGVPKVRLSPNEMYEHGLQTAGFIRVPPITDLYYALLPVEWRKIHHYGVEIGTLKYDGAGLNGCRNRESSWGGPHRGLWPISVDPRDRKRCYFQRPDDGVWYELVWVHAPDTNLPMNDALLAQAKRHAVSRLRGPPKSREVAREFRNLVFRIENEYALDAGERKALMKAFLHDAQVSKDRGFDLPASISPEYDLDYDDGDDKDSGWSIELASLGAYPVYGQDKENGRSREGDSS